MGLQLSLAAESGVAALAETTVDYLPAGVQTVRLVLNGDFRGEVRVRPRRMSGDPTATYGHEDGDQEPALLISWGGGHERYVAVDFPAKRLVHLLVWHIGEGQTDHQVTIDARDAHGRWLTSFRIKLTYPRFGGERWEAGTLNRARWEEVVGGLDGAADLHLTGPAVPVYQPRWWPQRRIVYTLDPRPVVRLRVRRRSATGNSVIHAFARFEDGPERPLAVVEGQIDPILYDTRHMTAQLFRFGRRYWVVRIWIFWLRLAYRREDAARHWSRSQEEIDAAWRDVATPAEGGTAVAAWSERHEVPDAERIDILFDEAGEPLFAATDLHWRELWGQFADRAPIEAEIMNTRARDLAANRQQLRRVLLGWGAIVLSRFAGSRPPYQPHKEVAAELAGASVLGADPIALESHSPGFVNITLQTRWTSTDVTDG